MGEPRTFSNLAIQWHPLYNFTGQAITAVLPGLDGDFQAYSFRNIGFADYQVEIRKCLPHVP